MHYLLKRIYLPFDPNDGYRVLVDRLWPRGMSKEGARLDEWAKELAPSSDLRKWFGHKPERFQEFEKAYLDELRTGEIQQKKLAELSKIACQKRVTLLYAARDPVYNHAMVLWKVLNDSLGEKSDRG